MVSPRLSWLRGEEARAIIRGGGWRRPTSGVAEAYAQANLVILPEREAAAFRRFCELNPKPCPLLDVTDPGSPNPRRAAPGADLRLEVPRYRVYRHGEVVEEPEEITAFWRDDLVSFLLGCSFTFEKALIEARVPLRHQELARTVPMYRTTIQCRAEGPFHGPMVVSMRPVPEHLVLDAVQVTAQYPRAHGSPVHFGRPEVIGIENIACPDYGEAVPVFPGEVPVFWACGVTPQAVAQAAKLPFMITHAPGHMFITDLREEELREGPQ